MDHVVRLRDRQLGVTDDRIVHGVPLGLLDVLGPALVITDRIDGQPEDLRVALVELGLESGHVAELGGADRREVLRMREQDRPLVPDPFVEADLAFRRLRGEVRCLVPYANSHVFDLPCLTWATTG